MMKTILALLLVSHSASAQSLPGIDSSTVSGENCGPVAVRAAKQALDLNALIIRNELSATGTSAELKNANNDGSKVYEVYGSIYKGEYVVEIKLDRMCALQSLSVREVGF